MASHPRWITVKCKYEKLTVKWAIAERFDHYSFLWEDLLTLLVQFRKQFSLSLLSSLSSRAAK